ncbi:hypothetical protein QTP88_028794 [Uroleucon formosanum]
MCTICSIVAVLLIQFGDENIMLTIDKYIIAQQCLYILFYFICYYYLEHLQSVLHNTIRNVANDDKWWMWSVTKRVRCRVANMSIALKHYYNQKIVLYKSDMKKCMLCVHKEISQTMLSLRSVENGREKEGIWGYLLKDIKAEITRGSRVLHHNCVYCNKKCAILSCMESNCSTQFHLPCGLKNGSMHHYFQSFNSFCQHHRIQPVINVRELHPFAPPTVECDICNGNVIPSTSPTFIWVPCCSTNGWFNRDCIHDLALRKGYFIECPKCENIDNFKSRILILGIHVPSSSWLRNKYNLYEIVFLYIGLIGVIEN